MQFSSVYCGFSRVQQQSINVGRLRCHAGSSAALVLCAVEAFALVSGGFVRSVRLSRVRSTCRVTDSRHSVSGSSSDGPSM